MEVDSVAAKMLCPPNGKVNKAFSYLEVLTAASTLVSGADGLTTQSMLSPPVVKSTPWSSSGQTCLALDSTIQTC